MTLWGMRMLDYRIYFLDTLGRINLSYDFRGPDDLSALDEAKKYADKCPLEVWQRARLVARIDRDGNAAAAAKSVTPTATASTTTTG